MAECKITRAPRITAELRVPGDKSISHRAVLLAALADGPSVIRGFLPSQDCLRTVDAMRALGVTIETADATTLVVHGNGGALNPPSGAIDCGNSGTTMRLLAGLLAGQPFRSRLVGDPSLSQRPMQRLIDPLRKMGAKITSERGRAPLVFEEARLHGCEHALTIASAQVKSAILFAGMFATGRTSLTEPAQSRDHTERMLRMFAVEVELQHLTASIRGGQVPQPHDIDVPGDISSAAYWVVAAAAQPGARLLVQGVGLNPTRSGVLSVLSRMGANITTAAGTSGPEPSGTIEVRGRRSGGTEIGGDEIPNVIDELPVLAIAAALAEGRTVIRDAAELRVKESDRLSALATNLRALGADVNELPAGLSIVGGALLRGARLESCNDHRIAMAFAIAGLFAEGETTIIGTECVTTSYPGFWDELRRLTQSQN